MPATQPPPQPPGYRPGHSPRIERSHPYLQVAAEIRRTIGERGLRPGDRLPSYKELAAEYHVSVPTVQNAIMIMVGQGLVEIRPGSGTYISDLPFAPTGLDRMSRYVRTGRIYPPGESAQIISAERVVAPEYIAEALAVSPGSMVVRRLRITRYEDRVVSMSTSWIPARFAEVVPALLETVPIPDGTVGAICHATGIRPGTQRGAMGGRDQLMARAANQAEAHALHITVGEPVLAAANWFYGQYPQPPGAPEQDGEDVVVEFGESVHPSGRWAAYEYHLHDTPHTDHWVRPGAR